MGFKRYTDYLVVALLVLQLTGCKQKIKDDYYKQNTFYLVSKPCGKCLDVTHGSIESGAAIILNTCNGSLSQQWKLDEVDSSVFQIRSRTSGLVMGTNAALTEDRAIIKQYGVNGSDNFKWYFEKKGAYFTLLNRSADKYITNPGSSDDNYVCVMIFPELKDDSQLWEIRRVK